MLILLRRELFHLKRDQYKNSLPNFVSHVTVTIKMSPT